MSRTTKEIDLCLTGSPTTVLTKLQEAGEALSFTLTITDANGEADSVPVTAFVLLNLSQPFLYFRRQQNSTNGLVPETATLESPSTGTVVTTQNTNTLDFGFSMKAVTVRSGHMDLNDPIA